LDFLGDVEAVEEHHRGGAARARDRPVGMHQQRRQRRALVGNLDVFDARATHERGRVAKCLHRSGVDVETAPCLRLQEALAGLVVAGRAQQTGGGGLRVAGFLRRAPARLDGLAHAGPFRKPGGVVADLAAQRAADAIDLVDFGAAPGRAAQTNQQAHRPAIVIGEIQKCRIVAAIGHCGPSRAT
jgi:hypothetical protein